MMDDVTFTCRCVMVHVGFATSDCVVTKVVAAGVQFWVIASHELLSELCDNHQLNGVVTVVGRIVLKF